MTRNAASTSGPIRTSRKNLHQQSNNTTYRDASESSSRVPPTRAKSGCWTCRLRRKKCDENRRADGSCDTCKRLRLECLGWGAKRPEWCRDKSQVERYKTNIKQKVNDVQRLYLSTDNPSIIITDASSKSNLSPLMPANNMNNGGMHRLSDDPFNSIGSTQGMSGEDAFGFTANASIHNNTPSFTPDSGVFNGGFGNLGGFPFPFAQGDLDMHTLDSFLTYMPSQYQHQPDMDMQPSHLHLPGQANTLNGSPIWSNQTTPELISLQDDPFAGAGNGIFGNPALISLYGQTQPMQPITNAIEQSMVGVPPSTSTNSNNPFSAQNNSNNSGTTAVDGSCLEVNSMTVSGSNESSSSSADGSSGSDNVEGDPLHYSIPVIPDSDSSTYPTQSQSQSHLSNLTSTAILHSPLSHSQSLQSLQPTSHHAHTPGLSLPRTLPTTATTSTNTNSNTGTGQSTSAKLDTTASAKVNPPVRLGPLDIQLVQRQIFYYFNRVRKMQYCFAGETTKDVLRDMVVANPYGVVTNAICALASIHHILVRKSLGQETEDPESPTSLPRRFYEQANAQIMASKSQNGAYTAQDATAALQFVSFSLFVGGVHGWENALKIAGDWYEKTGVVGHEAPLRAMWELNLTAKFASRLVVWFDIFAAITLRRPPRFLATYRRMLRQADDGSGTMTQSFWRKDLNMQATMGCPDAVLLALAETADLAHWKDQEKKSGSLSNRELNRRADLIEEDLKACREECELEEARAVLASSAMAPVASAAYFGSAYANTTTGMNMGGFSNSAPGTPSSSSGESVLSAHQISPTCGTSVSLPSSCIESNSGSGTIAPQQMEISPVSSSTVTPATCTTASSIATPLVTPTPREFNASYSNQQQQQQNPIVAPLPTPSRASTASSTHSNRSAPNTDPVLPAGLSDADIRRRAGRIFLEGASLYLQTVVSDSNPNVPEIAEGVRATMEAAYLLPPSDVDKSLVFPFTLAGCLADNTEQRAFFKARLGAHRSIGNCLQAVRLMDTVWQKRDEASALLAKGIKPPRVHWREVMDELGMNLLLV